MIIASQTPSTVSPDSTLYAWFNGGALGSETRRKWFFTGCSLCTPPFNTREVRTTTNNIDASWRLISSAFRLETLPNPGGLYKTYQRKETYRYDPLGRRVWKEMIRDTAQSVCVFHDASSGCRNEVTRTVWDGANILYDVRMLADTTGDGSEGYPSAGTFTGSVGYTHAGGVDVPLDLWKGTNVVVPYADWRGTYDVGTCPTTRCTDNQAYFPLKNSTAFGDGPVLPTGPPNWFGEVIGGQTDGSGYKYMRNRYFDARSGRFTQEDPLGLASGLNSYGFAAGDPIQFSDPFGLCPGCKYATKDEAAIAAMKEIEKPSRRENVEYGGEILKTSDGSYTYTKPRTQGKEAGFKPNTRVAGYEGAYHSHGGESPEGDHKMDEHPSSDDELAASKTKKPVYTVTPGGKMWRSDPHPSGMLIGGPTTPLNAAARRDPDGPKGGAIP